MIVVQNGKNATKRNCYYGAEQFSLFWAKRAVFSPESY